MKRKRVVESIYLDNGETVDFYSDGESLDLKEQEDYLYEWADIIADTLGNDAYYEFKKNVINNIFGDKESVDVKPSYKALKDAISELGTWVFTLSDTDKAQMNEEAKEVINNTVDDLSDKLVDLGECLYDVGYLEEKDLY